MCGQQSLDSLRGPPAAGPPQVPSIIFFLLSFGNILLRVLIASPSLNYRPGGCLEGFGVRLGSFTSPARASKGHH